MLLWASILPIDAGSTTCTVMILCELLAMAISTRASQDKVYMCMGPDTIRCRVDRHRLICTFWSKLHAVAMYFYSGDSGSKHFVTLCLDAAYPNKYGYNRTNDLSCPYTATPSSDKCVDASEVVPFPGKRYDLKMSTHIHLSHPPPSPPQLGNSVQLRPTPSKLRPSPFLHQIFNLAKNGLWDAIWCPGSSRVTPKASKTELWAVILMTFFAKSRLCFRLHIYYVLDTF